MRKLIIINTYYSLFLYILIDPLWKDNFYAFDEGNFDRKQLNYFDKQKINYITFTPLKYDKNIKKNINNYLRYIKSIIKIGNYILKKNIKIINGSDNIFPLILNFNLKFEYIIEDGMLNYQLPKSRTSMKKRIIDFLLLRPINYRPYGYSENIKKIYLTGSAPIPKEIRDKVEIISIAKLWRKKTKIEKEEILNIFGFDKNSIEKIKNKKSILFTQPLSEDNFITEKEKIRLYEKIISNYSLKELIIKKHPREKTDYKKYFYKIEIIEQNFPAELLNLLDIKFEKIITIFSTAALNFSKDSKIDFYGTKIHPNLLKLWGDSEKIMKANKFINEEK